MTTTVTGFDGSIDEASFSRGQALGTRRAVVASRTSFAATTLSDSRSVRLAGGSAWDAGVLVECDDAVAATVAIPAPQAGQWSLITLRRSWDNNGVTYEVLPHTSTTTATPTAPPTGLPSDYQDKPGRLADQPLWWAWAVTGSTALILVDARQMSGGLEKRGTVAQRTAYYGATPGSLAGRRALQGATWFNTDTNLNEVYMALYQASTNPGGVKDPSTAGWYSVGTDGSPRVYASRFPDTLTMPGNRDSLMDRLQFTLGQGRLLHFVHKFRWRAPSNAAGTMYVTLDGDRLPDSVRVHSEGGMQGSIVVQVEWDFWVPAGAHDVRVYFDNEKDSNTTYKQDAWTLVTGGARS